MSDEMIVDPNCKHNWIKRESRNPLNPKQIFVSWEVCSKCGSEKARSVY